MLSAEPRPQTISPELIRQTIEKPAQSVACEIKSGRAECVDSALSGMSNVGQGLSALGMSAFEIFMTALRTRVNELLASGSLIVLEDEAEAA